jgi:hypothetical protein
MRLKLVAVAVAALAPVAAMLAYNEFAIRSQRNEELRATAAQAARQASSEVDRIIEGLHSLLIAVTSMPAVRDLDAAACSRALTSVASNVPNVRVIFVVDLQGTPVCASQNAPDGVSFADRDYFQKAIANNAFVVGSYTRSWMSEAAVLPVAVVGKPIAKLIRSTVNCNFDQDRFSSRVPAVFPQLSGPNIAKAVEETALATASLGQITRVVTTVGRTVMEAPAEQF